MNKQEEKKNNKKNKTQTHTTKIHKNTKLKTIIYKQETSKKEKKSPNQSIQDKKKSTKMPLSLFHVGHLLLGMGSSMKCCLYTQSNSIG